MRKASSLPVLFTLSVAFILCCSIVNLAQNREKFVISAKAGGINAITGQADVHPKGESDWQQLSITDDLDSGDRVRTANGWPHRNPPESWVLTCAWAAIRKSSF